jgi:hypothetical protein
MLSARAESILDCPWNGEKGRSSILYSGIAAVYGRCDLLEQISVSSRACPNLFAEIDKGSSIYYFSAH